VISNKIADVLKKRASVDRCSSSVGGATLVMSLARGGRAEA
jgi:hypothetical protein